MIGGEVVHKIGLTRCISSVLRYVFMRIIFASRNILTFSEYRSDILSTEKIIQIGLLLVFNRQQGHCICSGCVYKDRTIFPNYHNVFLEFTRLKSGAFSSLHASVMIALTKTIRMLVGLT